MSRLKVQIAVGLAVMGVLLVASVAHAQGGPPGPNGRWSATDIDGSTVSLTLAGPPSGPYRVTWTDSFWTLCGGGPGLGTGSATRSGTTLTMDIDFECFRTSATAELIAQYTFDESTQTLTLVPPNDLAPPSFSRPGGP